jgi:hypothetical protein
MQDIAIDKTDTTGTRRPARRDTRPGSPEPLTDPRQARPGEEIGAGYLVFRRGGGSGRIRTPEYPFEHPSLAAALTECNRLSAAHPGHRFEVWARVAELAP